MIQTDRHACRGTRATYVYFPFLASRRPLGWCSRRAGHEKQSIHPSAATGVREVSPGSRWQLFSSRHSVLFRRLLTRIEVHHRRVFHRFAACQVNRLPAFRADNLKYSYAAFEVKARATLLLLCLFCCHVEICCRPSNPCLFSGVLKDQQGGVQAPRTSRGKEERPENVIDRAITHPGAGRDHFFLFGAKAPTLVAVGQYRIGE